MAPVERQQTEASVRITVKPELMAALEAEALIARASNRPLSVERLREALKRWAQVRVLCWWPVALYAAAVLGPWARDDEDETRWERWGDVVFIMIAMVLAWAIFRWLTG